MSSYNNEILWNRIGRLKEYDRNMAEVYGGLRKIFEQEYAGVKANVQSLKTQVELITKLSQDIRQKPFFMMINDTLQMVKETANKKIAMLSEQMKHMGAKVINPLGELLNENERHLAALSQADKNLAFMQEYRKGIDAKFAKLAGTTSQYELLYEDEQIRQQLKNFEVKVTEANNAKLQKQTEKIKEDERAYLFQLENYNTHMPKLLTENVSLTNEGRDYQRPNEIFRQTGREVQT